MSSRYNVDPGDTGIDVGCVVQVHNGQLSRQDLEIIRVNQIDVDPSLLDDNEQLVSNVLQVRMSADVTVGSQ